MASIQDIRAHYHPAVVERGILEFNIVRRTAKVLLKAGYSVSVFDGEEICLKQSRKLGDIMAAVMSTDEDKFYCYITEGGEVKQRMVYFVYGNSGWDVINDYSVSLEAVLKPVNDYADKMGAR
jgi:hypothetical protein